MLVYIELSESCQQIRSIKVTLGIGSITDVVKVQGMIRIILQALQQFINDFPNAGKSSIFSNISWRI